MPYWAVVVIVVVIVVGYFLLSQAGRERRRQAISADFGKLPDFHANQVYMDVRGATAIGLDDRGRRIAVARKHAQPRTRIYSFAHIVSAEILQNDRVIGKTAKKAPVRVPGAEATEQPPAEATEPSPHPAAGQPHSAQAAPSRSQAGAPAEGARGSLFGSTARGLSGMPVIKPALGRVTMLGVRVTFEEPEDPGVLLRFYEGRPVNIDSVPAEKALGDARTCLNALDVAVKRAALPPRPAISGRGLGPR
jgi:hypothetical protein